MTANTEGIIMHHDGILHNFRKKINNTIEEEYARIKEIIDNMVQENIMNCVGEDLYDYSNVVDLDKDKLTKANISISMMANVHRNNGNKERLEKGYLNWKNNMVDGERIVLAINYRTGGGSPNVRYFYLTNYGRLLSLRQCVGQYVDTGLYVDMYHEYNYWIPKDYIFILQEILNKSGKPGLDELPAGLCFENKLNFIVSTIKTNLYNGKYVKNNVDIHFMDVYQEKQKLLQEQKEFDKYKEHTKNELKKQTEQLEKDKKEIDKQKEKFRLIAAKIKIEQVKLKKQKE